ncbi:MAG: hypothetical protein QNK29_01365, partial [Desulfobacterales bacterium]|nr:hypothetical protein [Desulfobacterales bacterium]
IFMKPVAKTALKNEFGVDAAAVQAAIAIFAIIYGGSASWVESLAICMAKRRYTLSACLYMDWRLW